MSEVRERVRGGAAVARRRRAPLILLGIGSAAYAAVLRPWLRSWGATRGERDGHLPGDDLVSARWQTTRGIRIDASAAEVWPWLVQMGYGRGGWYSYDGLERRIGAGDFAQGGSATSVIAELQGLEVGDPIALSPAGGLTVAILDPPTALVLAFTMNLLTAAPAAAADRAVLDWTWAFVLAPVDERSCRLLIRTRADYRPTYLGALIPFLLEPVHFVMERRMLRTLRSRLPSSRSPSTGRLPPDGCRRTAGPRPSDDRR